jgi:cytoskeleton protein RodZ
MTENGKPVFEEAAAERELDELRQAIEDARARRRRASAAFDDFLKGFPAARAAAAVPPPLAPPPRPQDARAAESPSVPQDDGLSSFSPAPGAAAAVSATAPGTVDLSSLDDFAQEGPVTPRFAAVRSIPAALAPARTSAVRRAAPLIGVAVVGVLAVFLWSRGGSGEESAPPEAAAVSSAPPAPSSAPAAPPAATSGTQTPPPAAEVATTRRVWMRVTVDGQRVVEREVPEGTRIPLTGSQIVIRAGDAGAVRVSIAGKDQGALGPAGQVATRTFSLKP